MFNTCFAILRPVTAAVCVGSTDMLPSISPLLRPANAVVGSPTGTIVTSFCGSSPASRSRNRSVTSVDAPGVLIPIFRPLRSASICG
jgi:hypothetical protein